MHTPRTIAIVAGSVRQGQRCTYCRQPIVWATAAATRKYPVRALPFSERPVALRRDAHPETGVTYEIWPRAALHLATCPNRPSRRQRAQESR